MEERGMSDEVPRHQHDNGRVCDFLGDHWRIVALSPYDDFKWKGRVCSMMHDGSDELSGFPTIGAAMANLLRPRIKIGTDTTKHVVVLGPEPATDDARYIMTILPGIIEKFLEKNKKYAEVEQGYDLGDAGIIPDLNRKLGILYARIWKGAEEVGEPTDEVIGDMIGHLLLMLAKRNGPLSQP
jgi:hypothetical protein